MDKNFLKYWYGDFPSLRFILSKEDRDILSTIDPAEYALRNITSESEVICIINEHKPQAWKWIRMFPNLKNLSAEDHVILDHIVVNHLISNITEADVRRIIELRKSELHKKEEAEKLKEAKEYYQKNREAIEKEERSRKKISRVVAIFTVFGIAFFTPGVVAIGTKVNPVPYFVLGTLFTIAPWLIAAVALKEIDDNSIAPRNKREEVHFNLLSIAFMACYYITLTGVGILLGSLPVYERFEWDVAENTMLTGFALIIAAVAIFFIALIATPSEE